MDVTLVAARLVVVLALLLVRARIVVAALLMADGVGEIIFRDVVDLRVNRALGLGWNH
ncbi:MAG TPA: hypothetical protein VKE42_00985 [Candidatus Cybelea sp.]|nr:hypothetical protein [Candidatus Cybelea sp.]